MEDGYESTTAPITISRGAYPLHSDAI